MELPDYHGGSIVNLMRSIERTLDARPCDAAAAYPELSALPAEALSGARNIVLLVIDGLGYDYLLRDGARDELPHGRRPAAARANRLAYLAARTGLPRGDAALSPAPRRRAAVQVRHSSAQRVHGRTHVRSPGGEKLRGFSGQDHRFRLQRGALRRSRAQALQGIARAVLEGGRNRARRRRTQVHPR